MKISLIAFLMFSLTVSAQQEPVFKVSASKKIYLDPAIDTLIAGKEYMFSLQGMKVEDIVQTKFDGGIIGKKGLLIIVRTKTDPDVSKKYHLQLYAFKNGAPEVVFQKDLSIISTTPQRIIPPQARMPSLMSIYWNSVPRALTKSDSIPREVLRKDNFLEGYDLSNGARFKVISFKLTLTHDGKTEEFLCTGDRFSQAMEKALTNSKSDCLVIFDKVQTLSIDGSQDVSLSGPFKILVKN